MEYIYNSTPSREYIIVGSPCCGYVGYGWRSCYPRRRCCRRHRHRCYDRYLPYRDYEYGGYPYNRLLYPEDRRLLGPFRGF